MKEIKIGKHIVKVDDDDAWIVEDGKWYADDRGRQVYFKSIRTAGGKTISRYLHREIVSAPKGAEVDHIDCDCTNNQKSNLRICTRAQNSKNLRPQENCTSKYKGVYWNKHSQKWHCQMSINGKNTYLGSFPTEDEAAIMYNIGALKYYGEFARFNNPRMI